MTDYSLAFSPLLPMALLVALAVGGAAIVALGLVLRQRAVWLRALGLALILLALFDPSLVREDRTPLKQVVALVVDRSGSQTIGDRTAQTDKAAADLEKRLKALGNIDVRVIEGGKDNGANEGTQLFAALNAGLADVPAEQIAGVFMITDGVVHDIPEQGRRARFQGAAARLHHRSRGRARPPHRTRRGTALRHRRQGPDDCAQGAGHGQSRRAGEARRAPRRQFRIATVQAAVGETVRVPVQASSTAARTWSNSRWRHCPAS